MILREFLESGKVTPVIDRMFPVGETPPALGHVGTGHARGKLVITI
jgi:NADPH:quinone reductase-like Zn-dependent oxidoreductase